MKTIDFMNLKLIIGLGNPDLPAGRQGKKYENTYHNVGFLFIDYLRNTKEYESTNSYIRKNSYFVKSNAFMNESGKFVAKELKKSNAKPEELLIVHDDSDIEIGKYKLSFGRGAAGHHGVENVQAALKTNNFWRLRIGIRSAADLADKTQTSQKTKKFRVSPRLKAGEFVLRKITVYDKKILERVFEEIIVDLDLSRN